MAAELLVLGVRDGLIWLPIILGFALLHRHLRHIDVSVDGVVIIAGITAAVVWNGTQSYAVSIGSAVIAGMALSASNAVLYSLLGVPQLMVGIIFSLIAHAVSVQWIGESVRLGGTELITGIRIETWLPFLGAALLVTSALVTRTRSGTLIRKLGDGVTVNTARHPLSLYVTAYVFAGALYGLGAALYVHKIGTARAGGNFDVLVIALCSFLSIQRLLELLRSAAIPKTGNSTGVRYSKLGGILVGPEAAALGGACFYGILVHTAIAYAPDPRLWKVLLALCLLVAVFDFRLLKPRLRLNAPSSREPSAVVEVDDVRFSYSDGPFKRTVFDGIRAEFHVGLTLLVGPNGSGKSTLLRLISGHEQCETGHIYFDGKPLEMLHPNARSAFFVTQDARKTLGDSLTIGELLEVSTPRRRLAAANGSVENTLVERLAAYSVDSNRLASTGFDPRSDIFWRQRVATLSGGQATIVAIYACVLSEARVLLLDEPTTGVDNRHFDVISDLLRAVSEHHCVIATTHDARLRSIAHDVLQLSDGRLSNSQPSAAFHRKEQQT